MDFSGLKQSQTAKATGYSVRSVRRWGDDGCPRNKDGTYDLPLVIQWLLNRESQESSPDDAETQKWLTAFRRERALIAKLEREKLEGNFASKEAVEIAFADRLHELKRTLLTMSSKIGHQIAGRSKRTLKEVTEIIDEEVYQLLESYSRPMNIKE